MVLPKKKDILQKAKEISLERQVRTGLPALTPEEEELKESGVFEEAREDLMRDPAMVSEQMKYLSEMAGEMSLKVIPTKELHELKRETGYEWTNGWTKTKPKPKPKLAKLPITKHPVPTIKPPRTVFAKPKAVSTVAQGKRIMRTLIGESKPKLKPKPKPKKRHIQRNGETMRKLQKRIKDGQKTFSFPDHIWKVRK